MVTDTKEIIKFLPFEEDFKRSLLEQFDQAQGQQKFELDSMVWRAYYQVYEAQLQQNIQLELQQGKEKMDEHFYAKIREKTEKELDDMIRSESKTSDLSAARKAMEKIVQEIHAAKKK